MRPLIAYTPAYTEANDIQFNIQYSLMDQMVKFWPIQKLLNETDRFFAMIFRIFRRHCSCTY
jgi:hypothetical protein